MLNYIKNAITVLSFLLFLSLRADSIDYYLPARVTGQSWPDVHSIGIIGTNIIAQSVNLAL